MKINTIENSSFAREFCLNKSPIEWWFLQGHYKEDNCENKYFMLSLFKHKVNDAFLKEQLTFSFILSVCDPSKAEYQTVSQIDPKVVDLLKNVFKKNFNTNLDKALIEAYMDELIKYGPPKPIECLENPQIDYNNKVFNWGNLSLKFEDNCLKVEFQEPDTKKHCKFVFKKNKPGIHINDFNIEQVKTMEYASYTSLLLEGMVDSKSVKGDAWFDHQWGDYGGWFFGDSKQGKLLGWDWLGVNLDDQRDLLIMVHKDMQSNKAVYKYAILVDKHKPPLLINDFDVQVKRYWQSPKTKINYPISSKIIIPQIKAEIDFEAVFDNQEIEVLGFIRAIWEGAGKVTGKIDGKQVSGVARLELYGYGFIFDFQDYLKIVAEDIDKHIEDFLPKILTQSKLEEYVGKPTWRHEPYAYTKTILEPVWDLMQRQGKHWRPIFGLLLMETLGIDSKKFEKLISLISELTHTGALIIDDIEDNSQLRRSQECIHLKYGIDVAINAGNTIYFLPYLLLAQQQYINETQRNDLYNVMVKQFVQAHFGQALDIYWSRNMNFDNLKLWIEDNLGDKILQMYEYKTASAVMGLSDVVSVVGSLDSQTRKNCCDLARAFGVSFQVIDDVLNFSDSSKWTKTRGEDLRQGKLSYVIYKALFLLKNKQRDRLIEILCSKELRESKEGLAEGIELIDKSNSLEICKQEAQVMIRTQWDNFSKKVSPSQSKVMLKLLCFSLLHIAFEI